MSTVNIKYFAVDKIKKTARKMNEKMNNGTFNTHTIRRWKNISR
jgi:hypothetical protein